VPTDQAKIVRVDQLELQEHCNADRTAATRVLTKGKACSTLRAVADGFQDLYSIRLTESLCPPSPSGRAEAVPTDQAEIVRDDQLGLQEHCNSDHAAATRVDDGQGLCSPARCRRWTAGLTIDSLNEPLCPSSPSGRVEAVSTDQAEIVREDQLELQEYCNADPTAATRVDDGQSLCSPARCRRWTSGLISDSLDESCCRPSPSGRVETVSTSQDELEQFDQPEVAGALRR
jgi:hypothetical protein